MSLESIATVISGKGRDLGGFGVRRILPTIGRKMVGPFIFLDHMGPAVFPPGVGMDVRPHPHIGLATVTFLFEGAMRHRDSLGSDQVIRPGDVNWMTAGRGIVHSERTPPVERASGGRIEGLQAWVALPRAMEECEPGFFHHAEQALPRFRQDGVAVCLLAGSAFGRESPVQVASDLIYLDVRLESGQKLTIPAENREIAIYALNEGVRVEGRDVGAGTLTVGRVGAALTVEAAADARVIVIGGAPLSEGREIWWNFVSSSKARLDQAKDDWENGRFPSVPGDSEEFIPLPE